MIKYIKHQDELLAIIIGASFEKEGIEFFTPNEFSQQLGYMKRPAGYKIAPHVHNPVSREVIWTQEVLFIKSGKIRVDFYDMDRNYIKSEILSSGDIILLASGGHGFTMLEEAEIIEVKQGPYCGDRDKTRFDSINEQQVKIDDLG